MPQELLLVLMGTYIPNLTRLLSLLIYYHTTDGEKRCMFPADPNIANTNVTSSDTGTPCWGLFRQEVKMRDVSCIVLGSPISICNVAHILPHMKGDQV